MEGGTVPLSSTAYRFRWYAPQYLMVKYYFANVYRSTHNKYCWLLAVTAFCPHNICLPMPLIRIFWRLTGAIAGYFTHVTTLAEVREQVQKYVPVLARPLVLSSVVNDSSRDGRLSNDHPVIWTGVYADIAVSRLRTPPRPAPTLAVRPPS